MKKQTLAVFITLACNPAMAFETKTIYTPQGQPVFELRFFDIGDGPYSQGEGGKTAPAQSSTWNLNSQEKSEIISASDYWAEIIKPSQNAIPGVINIGTTDEETAAAHSPKVSEEGSFSPTQLQAALTGNDTGTSVFGSDAQIIIGRLDFGSEDYVPSHTPRSTQYDLQPTIIHEVAHALGIASSIVGGEENPPSFGNTLGSYDLLMRDDNGNPAVAGQTIACSACTTPYTEDAFDIRNDQAYLTGQNIDDVLNGALPGVPVRMLSADGTIDDDHMSHLELKNSLMSHQEYRNYTTLMEAELAVLQDMGYQIDRRNFYGYSIYGDNQELVNTHGYFQRNTAGTDYISGEYNTATLGLGLHIYGSNNTVTQQADLLARGAGAAGVRIDGAGNTFTVAPDTRIYADGLNGRGVMFTYGKGHNFIHRGDIQATGDKGIGVSFDFGNNAVRNSNEYRGSYIYNAMPDSADASVAAETAGPLVINADISGRIAGQAAAIYISENAYVENINLMQGADITGDIISRYNVIDSETQQPYLTQLTLGKQADADGRATEQDDENFRFSYQGNIEGVNNLEMDVLAGYVSLNGDHQLYNATVEQGATLAGNSRYAVNEMGQFLNKGTLTAGAGFGDIAIEGQYQQESSGELLLKVGADQQHDTLTVSGNALLAGNLTIAPQAGWYANDWQLNSAELYTASSQEGRFLSPGTTLNSPTLQFSAEPADNESYQLTLTHADNAYSQYGTTQSSRRIGEILDGIAKSEGNSIHALLGKLDFSAADGHQIARTLEQLEPSAYSTLYASSLKREAQISDIINSRDFFTAPSRLEEDEWRSFAIPFGAGVWQDTQGSGVGYTASSFGIVAGAEKQSLDMPDMLWGFHGAVSSQSVDLKDPQSAEGKTTAFDLGLHARYTANPYAGTYLFGHSRVGIEDSNMTRRLSADSSNENKASWTGLSSTTVAGGGYLWAVSDALSAGPEASVNYTWLSHPEITESGDNGSNQKLDSNNVSSLVSSLGAVAHLNMPLQSGSAVKAKVQLAWEHQLLDDELTQDARFVSSQSQHFSSKNTFTDRDAMAVKTGASYDINPDVTLGADIATRLFNSDNRSVDGNLSATWRFR